jgi:hypothetical protein
MNRMVVICFAIVSSLLFFTGCYTYESISKDGENGGYPKTEDAIRITLADGSVIESPPYLHIATYEPTRIVMGVGQERTRAMSFEGIVKTNDLDSAKEVSSAQGEVLVCWLKNGTSLGFMHGQYLTLTKQDPAGFWCVGRRTTSVRTVDFRGIVMRDQIVHIEVEVFSVWRTATLVVITTPLAITAGAVINFFFTYR